MVVCNVRWIPLTELVKGPFGPDQKAPIHLLPKLQQNCNSMSKLGDFRH